MKQTAVEFLQECLSIHLSHQQQMQFEGLFQQAKEMEKEVIIDAYNSGQQIPPFEYAEKYYNETFDSDTNSDRAPSQSAKNARTIKPSLSR